MTEDAVTTARVRTLLDAHAETRELSGARLERLDGGVARRAWRATLGGRRWFVRVEDEVDTRALGADPDNEARLLELASAAGLAPGLEFVAPAAGLVVTAYIDGRVWTDADLHDAARLRRLGELLARLHALPALPTLRRVDFAEQMRRLAAQLAALGQAVPEGPRLEAEAAFSRLATLARPTVPSHNDVGPQNLIEDPTGRVWLVDWEYGGVGEGLYDLAEVRQRIGGRVDLLRAFGAHPPESDGGDSVLEDVLLTYAHVQALWHRLFAAQRASIARS